MMGRAIADRYAKVFYDLYASREKLELGLAELDAFVFILNQQPQFAEFLNAPQIEAHEKQKLMKKIFGNKFEETFINFISYLIEQKRLSFLSQILKEYGLLVDEHLGVWRVGLKTAIPISEKLETELRQKIEDVYKKKVVIHTEVDPNIIGGAILVIANEMADWSVKGRLKNLKEELLAYDTHI